MGLFGSQPYDRARLLEAAERARSRGRRRHAIACYRQVLAVETGNAELHERLAPLLAATRQRFDAWLSFRAAAQTRALHGDLERALAIHRTATRALPREIGAWREWADLLRTHGRERDAIGVLREGSLRFRRGRMRPQAIHLLRRVREIQPWHAPTVLELARLLAREDQREEALMLLEALEARVPASALRSVHLTRLRIQPTLGSLWRWLRAALRPSAAPRRGRFTVASPPLGD